MSGLQSGACLTTSRLNLKIITQDDLRDVFATMNYKHTAEIISFLSWPMTNEQAQRMVDKAATGWDSGQEFMYLARTKDDGGLVGYIGCHGAGEGVYEIGYWICESRQRKGYAAEMAQAVINFAFNVLDAQKVMATVAYGNQGSIGVLEKNGLKLVGEKGVPLPDGTTRPSHLFERTR